ncbi:MULTISPECIES: phosphatase PAP2 family protein [unclassified Bradyrhizobium]|uniref:phosphatase PAP2 family protein n=1 Tax=unclassified Bradyrhizobium TaxID=2631580 RepID=UPI00247A7A39|nr:MULTISPECIES: phosphatase PAP2 family protein [unclassified Bradyrhizobium]WGR71029.1 phosphatase PAP2 family protein [Bradyrhizobium sp. ISRA426]WGR75866.1 phosphatase PAP2 family protein [Bradyrhizobium sp. ISRA430]WGR86270.1 phosphatase PAP2 family protein [Bradyrhizobium sp. ISRA432]
MPDGFEHHTRAYGLYLRNWIALATLTLVIGISLPMAGFSLELDGETWGELCLSAVLVAAGHILFSQSRWRLAFVVVSIAQLGLLSMLAALLTYVAASASLPLQDATLDHWDRALGLDWAAYYRFMTARTEFLPYALLAYGAIALPPFCVPLVLGLTGHPVRLQRFTMATLLTLCIVAIMSALIPAIGTYQLYDLPTEFATYKATGYLIQLERLPVIRSGDLHVLVVSQIGGIVTFPSFHAAAAVLALWAWWGVWWMRPWAFLMSAAMLIATPLLGGHYFVDVFAGIAVAGIAIALASSIERRPFAAPAAASASLPVASA